MIIRTESVEKETNLRIGSLSPATMKQVFFSFNRITTFNYFKRHIRFCMDLVFKPITENYRTENVSYIDKINGNN